MMDDLKERFLLAKERITEVCNEHLGDKNFTEYFTQSAQFLVMVLNHFEEIEKEDYFEKSVEELLKKNHQLYQEILPQNYESSFLNPTVAAEKLGENYGQLLSAIRSELRSIISFGYEKNWMDVTIRLELFLEVYGAFRCAWEENKSLPEYEEIKNILYWFACDYIEVDTKIRVEAQLYPEKCFASQIFMNQDLTDVRYLFRFGEYITKDEIRMADYMNGLTDEKISLLADTYTEGYRIGFITGNKDISKKKVVGIHYTLGFERMVKKACENFEKIGLKPTIGRNPASLLMGKSKNNSGFFGAIANRQYDFDHDEDIALFFDKHYMNRRLEAIKNAYEKNKAQAALFGGPAVIDIFGEEPFKPKTNASALKLSHEQQKLSVEMMSENSRLVNEYIKGEERSFTIIAFPVPQIGPDFENIFDEIIRINTLDYHLYQGLQQKIIDALDTAEKVEIKGMNGNETKLTIALRKLENPQKESNFENCVADVNIPVGEVFTSPKLSGTNGTLHVKRVFLNELEYQNIKIELKDGMVSGYSCTNFETEEENKKYVMDNVLFHHETLPIGEFAIGTNTTAYVAAKKLGIGDKFPILIAEKMGPHFALGDTCYSHAEDVKVYNPDGKEIIARDNEVSILRKTEPAKAYFNCHTDITIPYDELGSLVAVDGDGKEIPIIIEGKFVLEGLEELNKPLLEEI